MSKVNVEAVKKALSALNKTTAAVSRAEKALEAAVKANEKAQSNLEIVAAGGTIEEESAPETVEASVDSEELSA